MSRYTTLRAAAALILLVGAAGCRDQLPTIVGAEGFPQGTLLQSATLDLTANIEPLGQFAGFTSPGLVGYGVVAANFDGALEARTLVRLGAFPDSVAVVADGTTTWDTVFTYTAGQMVARVDTVAVSVTGPVTLRMMALEQAWDPATATWTLASGADVTEPWRQPGGTLGRELARAEWAPRDTLFGDSILWQVDSLSVAQVAAQGFQGIAIVAEGGPARLQLGEFLFRTGVRPESRPDTVLDRTVVSTAGTFIYASAAPPAAATWAAGGISAIRTLFRVVLPDSVYACPAGTPQGPACPRLPLRDVALNDVVLLFRPEPVGGGFRPLTQVTVRLRSVSEPELGERAPIGPVIPAQPGFFSQAMLPSRLFAPAAPDTTVSLRMTQHVTEILARDPTSGPTSTALALIAEPEGGSFGHVRFAAAPRLRIVYTLPVQRTSP